MRQGDLFFRKVAGKAIGKPMKKLVIAYGEATGHQHVLVVDSIGKIVGNKTHFTVTGKARLLHPEHDTIQFETGTYQVIHEREWDYIENEMKKVED